MFNYFFFNLFNWNVRSKFKIRNELFRWFYSDFVIYAESHTAFVYVKCRDQNFLYRKCYHHLYCVSENFLSKFQECNLWSIAVNFLSLVFSELNVTVNRLFEWQKKELIDSECNLFLQINFNKKLCPFSLVALSRHYK